MSHHANREAWRKNLAKAANQSMVLGVDIGGTKMHWATFPVIDGHIVHTPIAEGELPTPKGPVQLIKAYSRIVEKAIENSPDHFLAGVGVASPGRFIEATEEAHGISLNTAARDWITPQKSKLSMMGKGSAFNMWREGKPGDFDSVALESAFRRSTPRGVPVVAENDAAAQMQGFAYQLRQNGDRDKIDGRTLAYIAPGTGLGTGMRGGDGTTKAYGYYQEMALGPRGEDGIDKAVFDTTLKQALEREKALPPEKMRLYETQAQPRIQAEDLLSGTGLGRLLSTVVPEASLPHDSKGRFDLRAFGKAYCDYRETGTSSISNMGEAIAYLESAGRYLGDMLVKLHSGNYEPLDPERHMGKAYHQAAKHFQTLLFGGGVSGAAFYREVMLPQAEAVLTQAGIRKSIDIILPKNPELEAAYAAASQINDLALAREPEQLARTVDDTGWRQALREETLIASTHGR